MRLTVTDLRPEDAGRYRLRASNGNGDACTESALTVDRESVVWDETGLVSVKIMQLIFFSSSTRFLSLEMTVDDVSYI